MGGKRVKALAILEERGQTASTLAMPWLKKQNILRRSCQLLFETRVFARYAVASFTVHATIERDVRM